MNGDHNPQVRSAALKNGDYQLLDPADDRMLLRFHPDPPTVRRGLATLQALRLSVFRCGAQDGQTDWANVAGRIKAYAVPEDRLLVTNPWAAGCLSEALARPPAISLRWLVGPTDLANAIARLQGGLGAFVVQGGDLAGRELREWASRLHPLYRARRGRANLWYYPNRRAFMGDRQDPAQTLTDEGRVWGDLDGDLTRSDERDPFLFQGWEVLERDGAGAFRWATATQATFYVPVAKRIPSRLRVHVTPLRHPALPQSITVRLNDVVVAGPRVLEGGTEWLIDLGAGPWRFGANFLDLQFAYAVTPAALHIGDDPRTLAALFRYARLE